MKADILVVGGGATGASVARDAALRGLSVVLVERADLASGTTGHFHGQLHSGARYAVADPVAAAECAAEATVLRRVAQGCISDTGGYVVSLPGDDLAYGDVLAAACARSGIPCEEMPAGWLHTREPALAPAVDRVFAVPDAVLDASALVRGTCAAAAAMGAAILPQTAITGMEVVGGAIVAGWIDGPAGVQRVETAVVVNAAGPWGASIAGLAGLTVRLHLAKGVMVAMPGHPLGSIVSRCRPAADGDILVPWPGELVIGTTDEPASGPDDLALPAGAVERLVHEAALLVPGIAGTATRAWAAIRPLVAPPLGAGPNRSVSRGQLVVDHAAEGVAGLVTAIGGKATTCRLIAEEAVDVACRYLGVTAACTTASEPIALPPREGGLFG